MRKRRERDEESLRVKKKSCERILNNGRGSEMNGGVSSEESHTGVAQQRPFTHWT